MILIFSVSSIPASDASLPGSILMGVAPSLQSILHIPEYGLLSCLCLLSLLNWSVGTRRASIVALCFCLIFAAADEWYQHFIPGRFMSLGDWIYDAVGVFAGLAVVRRKT
ncbi:MAG: VanZ family protein [bacterium]